MNILKRSNASSKPGRKAPKQNSSNMRDSDTIKRLKMYNYCKAIRNKEGTVGGTKITGTTGRIAPDGCWFGNTRVVGITDLDKFRGDERKGG